jgi:cytochrome c553
MVRAFSYGLARTALVISLAVGFSRPPKAQPAVEDSMQERVLACTPCHGVQGGGTNNDYFPRLAGKPSGYLFNQLVAFRDGRRKYAPMNYLLEYQPDAYLQRMADHFAAERAPLPRSPVSDVSREVLARGQSLATQGDPTSGVPACAGCHNPSLTGMEPGIPGLVGLRPNYITAQLGAWRYGTRTAAAPDCMQIVAGHLTEPDVAAAAAYLSSLPIPADPVPVARGTLAMPLACGSEPQ